MPSNPLLPLLELSYPNRIFQPTPIISFLFLPKLLLILILPAIPFPNPFTTAALFSPLFPNYPPNKPSPTAPTIKLGIDVCNEDWHPLFDDNDLQCRVSCLQGQYASGNFCAECNKTCASCDQLENNCTSCLTGTYLIQANGICVVSCPIGMFTDESTGICT